MNNYGLELVFWVVLGVYLIYQYEEFKKKLKKYFGKY